MYQVCADINDIEFRQVLLDDNYEMHADQLLAACDDHTKIIWICSPNNPTGNSLNRDEILKVIEGFEGIVIVDEAYIDFAQQLSLRQELATHPNLIILQTMSKAWGSAAIRLGMAFASKDIINIYNKVKYPYNVNQLTQQQAMPATGDGDVERPLRNRQICQNPACRAWPADGRLPGFAHLRTGVQDRCQLLPGKDDRRAGHL